MQNIAIVMGNLHVERDDRRYTLAELGVTTSTDAEGNDRLIINVPPNTLFGTREGQAVFDDKARRWDFAITGVARIAEETDASLRRKDSATNHTNATPRPVKWTEKLPRTKHIDTFLNDVDWEATSLGPLERWPRPLQVYLNLVLTDSQAAVIYVSTICKCHYWTEL